MAYRMVTCLCPTETSPYLKNDLSKIYYLVNED